MEKLILQPGEWLKTQNMADETAKVTLSRLEEKIKQEGWQDNPILVMNFSSLPGKYPIFNGNNRATLAEIENRPLPALLIKNIFDYWKVQRNYSTEWGSHDLEPSWCYDSPFHYAADIAKHFLIPDYLRARKSVLKAALEHLEV